MSSATSVESNYENVLNELDRHLAEKRSEIKQTIPSSSSASVGKPVASARDRPIAQYTIRFSKDSNQQKQPASSESQETGQALRSESRLKIRSISPVFRDEPKKAASPDKGHRSAEACLEANSEELPKNVTNSSIEDCDYQEDTDDQSVEEDATSASSVKYQNMTPSLKPSKRVNFVSETEADDQLGEEKNEIAEISKELIGFINEYFNYQSRPLSLKKKSKRNKTYVIRTSRNYYLQNEEAFGVEELAKLFKDESQLNEFGELVFSKFLEKYSQTDLVSLKQRLFVRCEISTLA